jgi:hypothetical protein
MKKLIIVLVCFQAFNLIAQEILEKEISTDVEKVTVFFENAQITRSKKVSVMPGKTVLKFKNLSPFIKPKSVQVKVNGDVMVLSVNHQQNFLENLDKPEELIELESTYKAIQGKISVEQAYISVIDEEIAFLQANRTIGGKNQELNVSNLKAASEFYSSKLTALKLKRIERMNTSIKLNEQLQKVSNQINSLTTKKRFPSGEILVTIDSKSNASITVDLAYLVDNAGWFPSYDIRAHSISDPLEIVYKANVHQDTKIDWKDVDLTFSSNNPSLSGTAPDLKPYYLNYNSVPPTYKTNINEVSGKVLDTRGNPLPGANVVVTGSTIGTIAEMNGYYSIAIPSNASSLQFSYMGYISKVIPIHNAVSNVYLEEDVTSLDDVVITGYAMADEEMDASSSLQGRVSSSVVRSRPQAKTRETTSIAIPTIQLENQTSVEFKINMPYSVKSNSKNYVVDMTTYEVPANYEYYCVPKIDTDAFLKGYVTNWEGYNLLEGEANIFFEETYIGKSILDVRYITDTLSISLGRDKSVIVNRDKIKDQTSWKFIGNKKEEKRAWRISVKNNKAQSIKMVLLDQVPVPTLEEIELQIEELSKGKRDKETGEILWDLQLNPNESKEFELRYSLKYPKNRNLVIE